jgi:hypothetical protein
MTQVLIDTGLPCFDDVLAKYAFTFHIQWSVCNNRSIRTCKENGASFVWIYLIAILGCFNVFFSFSWLLLFLFVCLFLFFCKRFIILQLSCGNYEAVACKISLSDTVIVCHQDLQ